MYVLLTNFMVCSNVDANCVHVAPQISHALYHDNRGRRVAAIFPKQQKRSWGNVFSFKDKWFPAPSPTSPAGLSNDSE